MPDYVKTFLVCPCCGRRGSALFAFADAGSTVAGSPEFKIANPSRGFAVVQQAEVNGNPLIECRSCKIPAALSGDGVIGRLSEQAASMARD